MAAPIRIGSVPRLAQFFRRTVSSCSPCHGPSRPYSWSVRVAGRCALAREGVVPVTHTASHSAQCRRISLECANQRLLTVSPAANQLGPVRGIRASNDRDLDTLGPHCIAGDSKEEHAWIIRLANENGYLSWCRNAYISSVAGGTIYGQEALVPYAKEVGIVLVFMGGLNLVSGTLSYVYNVVALRRKVMMSTLNMVFIITMAVIHFLLWTGAMALYLGYIEDEDHEEEKKPEETDRRKTDRS